MILLWLPPSSTIKRQIYMNPISAVIGVWTCIGEGEGL